MFICLQSLFILPQLYDLLYASTANTTPEADEIRGNLKRTGL